MKSDTQIDAIMQAIPESWRTRWCGGERGPCACMGCVQIANRQVIVEKITGQPYRSDPEGIDESKLREHRAAYADYKLSRAEWESWMKRHSPSTT